MFINQVLLTTARLTALSSAMLVAGICQAQTLGTIAGSGVNGLGEAAVANAQAQFTGVNSILRTPWNGFFTAEYSSNRIRWIGDDGMTYTSNAAGAGYVDNVPLAQAKFNGPNSVILAPDGSVTVFDSSNNRIRKIASNFVTPFAGTGTAGSSGDGGQASAASFNWPSAGVYGPDGSLYVVEGAGQRIRKIAPGGVVSTIAGTGVAGFAGDGGAATSAQLNHPRAIAINREGDVLYVTEQNRVRAIYLRWGTIKTLAGNGQAGAGGDGGWSITAQLGGNWTNAAGASQSIGALASIAVLSDGRVLVGDRANNKIRQITPDYKISTYAGSGVAGYTADSYHNGTRGYYGGGSLLQAKLNQPTALHVDANNVLYFSDFNNYAVRKFSPPANINDTTDLAWLHEVHPLARSSGCVITSVNASDAGKLWVSLTANATCEMPAIWSGAKLTTDAGPDHLPGFGMRVTSVVSTTTNSVGTSITLEGDLIGVEELIRNGSIGITPAAKTAIELSMDAFAASPLATLQGGTAMAHAHPNEDIETLARLPDQTAGIVGAYTGGPATSAVAAEFPYNADFLLAAAPFQPGPGVGVPVSAAGVRFGKLDGSWAFIFKDLPVDKPVLLSEKSGWMTQAKINALRTTFPEVGKPYPQNTSKASGQFFNAVVKIKPELIVPLTVGENNLLAENCRSSGNFSICGKLNQKSEFSIDRFEVRAEGAYGWETAFAVERPFTYKSGNVPLWGTWTLGSYIGAGATDDIVIRNFRVNARFEASVSVKDLRIPYDEPANKAAIQGTDSYNYVSNTSGSDQNYLQTKFQTNNRDVKVGVYAQPFSMVKIGAEVINPGVSGSINSLLQQKATRVPVNGRFGMIQKMVVAHELATTPGPTVGGGNVMYSDVRANLCSAAAAAASLTVTTGKSISQKGYEGSSDWDTFKCDDTKLLSQAPKLKPGSASTSKVIYSVEDVKGQTIASSNPTRKLNAFSKTDAVAYVPVRPGNHEIAAHAGDRESMPGGFLGTSVGEFNENEWENSFQAIQNAFAKAPRWVEIDAQLNRHPSSITPSTPHGILFSHHNERCAEVSIAGYPTGVWWNIRTDNPLDVEKCAERVENLLSSFPASKHPATRFVIEMKTQGAGNDTYMARALYDLLKKKGERSVNIVSSMDESLLSTFRTIAGFDGSKPQLMRVYGLLDKPTKEDFDRAKALEFKYVAPNLSAIENQLPLVDYAKKIGLYISSWHWGWNATNYDIPVANQLAHELDLDMFITDSISDLKQYGWK